MNYDKSIGEVTLNSCTPFMKLLVIGPLPPPLGGATTSVKLLLDELAKYKNIQSEAINTSPVNYRKKTRLFKFETLYRSARILKKFTLSIRKCDAVLLFATGRFIFGLGYLLFLIAKQYQVPFFIKPLGGDMKLYLESHKKSIIRYMLFVLSSMTGIMVQTRQLQAELNKLGCFNTYYIPGYRPVLFNPLTSQTLKNRKTFHLVFLSQIVREKGALILLEALRILASDDRLKVICDFYGPILEEDSEIFLSELETTPNAKYCGVVKVGTASQLIAEYDALAFPTYYVGEGHPGVIIEAMQAGIPVISTQYRAIPELIIDGENGFLVPVGDSSALAKKIKRLASDISLRKKMGKANHLMGQKFRSDRVVSQMLQIIFPGSFNHETVDIETTYQNMSFRSRK